jgi:SAM-dependent methyltransferase
MDVATLDELLSPAGQEALAAAAALDPAIEKYPAHLDRLGRTWSRNLARAALDTVLLRRRARAKFTRAEAMYFTRESLEMATSEPVARYRAERFADFRTVADLGCGIGGDAIGLGLAGREVVAIDVELLVLRMAEANLAAYGLIAQFLHRDLTADPVPDADASFADPTRRSGGRRTLSVRDCEPPLAVLLGRLPAGYPLAVKLAPGVPREELAEFDADAEFISLGGELKECVLWFGPLRTGRVRASVLPGPHVLEGVPEPAEDWGPVGRFVYDPDPAVDRSGLVPLLAEQLGARPIDPGIAFLSADLLHPTPFASAYRVEEVVPFSPKRVGAWLRSHGVGRVTFVKRGSPVDVEELRRRWKLRGEDHRQVLLSRSGGDPVAIIAERVE